jgi:hypothetical protein
MLQGLIKVHIFQRYFNFAQPLTKAPRGTGLGVQQLIA